jgi:transcriptional regulator with XRE-family HTH domain
MDMASASDFDRFMARRLKRLRSESGRSQAKMAQALGLTTDNYTKIEQRGRLPTALVPRFAAILQVSTDFVLDVEDEMRRPITPTVVGRPRLRKAI